MYMPPPPPKRRIFGMTTTQVAILAALAVGNLLVIIVGAIVVLNLSSSNGGEMAAAELPTLYVMPPTATPGPTATTTLTPTPTPWPTVTPIAGWKAIQGQGVTLWLPEEYQGGDPTTDMSTLMQNYIAAGAEEAGAAQDMQLLTDNKASLFAFAAPQVDTALFMRVAIVYSEEVSEQTTLDSYLSNVENLLGPEFRLVGREEIALNELAAMRLSMERRVENAAGEASYKEFAFYFFKLGEKMWRLEYSCDRDLFAQNLPVFDQSARSFRVSTAAGSPTTAISGASPTSIPVPEAETVPTSAGGWVTFENNKVSISLPPSFDGGDMTQDADAILQRFGQSAPGVSVDILFFDRDFSTTKAFGYVLRDTIPAGKTLEDVLQAVKEQLDPSMQVVAQEEIALERYTARHWVIEFPGNNQKTAKMEIYFIQDGSDIWALYYFCEPALYTSLQPVFHQSADSFVIKEP